MINTLIYKSIKLYYLVIFLQIMHFHEKEYFISNSILFLPVISLSYYVCMLH